MTFRNSKTVLAVVTAILATVFYTQAQANTDRERYIVSFNVQPGPADLAAVNQMGGGVRHVYHLVPAIAVTLPDAAVEALSRNPRVMKVEKDAKVQAIDAELDNTWGVKRIGAGSVHSSGNVGAGAKLAVIDSGVDYLHSELTLAGGYDFVNNDSDPMDDNGHGTHVAGTVAAADDNVGVVGVAPGIELYALKVLDSGGGGYYSDVIAALEWCVDNGINITNNSFGSDQDPGVAVRAAYDNAYAAGILSIAAAGNSGNPPGNGDNIGYPARYDSVVAVTATDQEDGRPRFSSTGPTAELAAPGVNIRSTFLADSYRTYSGTSMASPHAAGTAALILAAGIGDENHDGKINDDIRGRLIETAVDLGPNGRDSKFGYGLIDAAAAVASGGDSQPGDPGPGTGGALFLTLISDKAVYQHGETASIDAWVYDQDSNTVENATVEILIQTPSGRNYTGSDSTDANGQARFSFKVNSKRDGPGAYVVDGTAAKASYDSDTASTTFQVDPK